MPETCASPAEETADVPRRRRRARPSSTADVATLADRTEGWAAALQLATLSMQGRDDVTGFVAGFAGDDRYVVDYLADEVLLPPARRASATSCCAHPSSTGSPATCATPSPDRPGGRAMLEALDRANLFLVPLDDRRHWYRYHHLFADVLRAHLRAEHPTRRPTLHRRASRWYAEAGEPVAAVRHALAAGDVDRAADLVEAAIPALRPRPRRRPRCAAGSTTSPTRSCAGVLCSPSASSAR